MNENNQAKSFSECLLWQEETGVKQKMAYESVGMDHNIMLLRLWAEFARTLMQTSIKIAVC